MIRTVQDSEAARELSERLALEYAGAVPPGRVLACVLRVQRHLSPLHLDSAQSRALLERVVRERLTMYIARPSPIAC